MLSAHQEFWLLSKHCGGRASSFGDYVRGSAKKNASSRSRLTKGLNPDAPDLSDAAVDMTSGELEKLCEAGATGTP